MLPEIKFWTLAHPWVSLDICGLLLLLVRRVVRRSGGFPPIWRFLLARPMWWIVVRVLGYKTSRTVYPEFRSRVRKAWEARLLSWLTGDQPPRRPRS